MNYNVKFPDFFFTYTEGCDKAVSKIGEILQLHCTIQCFGKNGFTWYKDNETLENGYGSSYIVTNFTIITFGGQNYSCLCESNNSKQCFILWGVFLRNYISHIFALCMLDAHFGICTLAFFFIVSPDVTVTFSSNPVMVGSSVNITCSAVSYPPATPHVDTIYILQHSNTETKHFTYATSDAVIYEISSATDTDDGNYNCHVHVMTMSERGEAYLNVVNGT